MDHFKLVSEYAPTGDQPRVIEDGKADLKRVRDTLQVHCPGKNIIMRKCHSCINKPTLITLINKMLVAR